jgi:hypothetical protein
VGVPSLQPLAAAPGLTVVDDLVGIGVAELRAFHGARGRGHSAA